MRGGLDRAFEYNKPRFSAEQQVYIQALYDGEESDLTREQLLNIEDITQERDSSSNE